VEIVNLIFEMLVPHARTTTMKTYGQNVLYYNLNSTFFYANEYAQLHLLCSRVRYCGNRIPEKPSARATSFFVRFFSSPKVIAGFSQNYSIPNGYTSV